MDQTASASVPVPAKVTKQFQVVAKAKNCRCVGNATTFADDEVPIRTTEIHQCCPAHKPVVENLCAQAKKAAEEMIQQYTGGNSCQPQSLFSAAPVK